jgi:hypothetical protein
VISFADSDQAISNVQHARLACHRNETGLGKAGGRGCGKCLDALSGVALGLSISAADIDDEFAAMLP